LASQRCIVSVLAGCAFLLGAAILQGDTVTVENVSQNVAAGTYTYAVDFDSQTDLLPGCGFVVYGFAGLTSWTLSGSGPSGALNSSGTASTSTGPFKMVESANQNALSDGNARIFADANAKMIAADNGITLDPSIDDLSFVWDGPPDVYTGSAQAFLTVKTTLTDGDTSGVYASIDRSGTAPGLSYSSAEGLVFVPLEGAGAATPVPLPSVLLSGLVMVGILVVGMAFKRVKSHRVSVNE
jgi:hypothetical protein